MANRVNLGNIIGATGLTGPQGPTGQNGADGLTPYIQNGTWWIGSQDTNKKALGDKWYYGTEIPTTQGNNGDLYLLTSTGDVYYKENGIWGLIANIKGAKGDTGEKGDTALSVTIGTVTTGEAGTEASVTNSGTNTDLVLDFVIPKGEKGDQGEQGETGKTTAFVGGFEVNTLVFDTDPQEQIDDLKLNKVDKNQGVGNAGKYLRVASNGEVEPVFSTAENDIIDCYIVGDEFQNNWLSETQGGSALLPELGKEYIIRTSGDYYLKGFVWNGEEYEPVNVGVTSVNGETGDITNVLARNYEITGALGTNSITITPEVTDDANTNSIDVEFKRDYNEGLDRISHIKFVDKGIEYTDSLGFNFKVNNKTLAYNNDFLKMHNITVNNWVADNTYNGYGYKGTIFEVNTTTTSIPQVTFGAEDSLSGNYLPIAESFNGGIYIWSKVNNEITIPTILIIQQGEML